MSRKNFGAKPYSSPQPVWILATYDENGMPNAMNAAWGGICGEDRVSICVDRSHKTTENIRERKAFTVSFATESTLVPCDYVGIVSGDKAADKFARAGFTATRSELVNAPIINELAVCMECRVIEYDKETCILKGEIVNVSVDEAALTDGKVDLAKVRPIAFDPFNNEYNLVGEVVGKAWGAGRALL